MNRRIPFLLSAAAVLAAPSLAEEGKAPSGWTLAQALRAALAQAPELASARLQRENAGDSVSNAVGKLLPSLDIRGAVGATDSDPSFGATAPFTSSLGATLTENLYDNGTSLIGWRQSHVARELSEVVVRRVRDNLCLSVATAFYRYALAVTLAGVRRDQLKLTEKQFLTVDQLYKQGLRARRDYLRFEAEVKRTRINLRQSEIAVESARADLIAAMGRPAEAGPVEFAVSEPPLEQVGDEPWIPKEAPPVDGTYAVREAALQARLSPFPAELARRQYWPTLNLVLSAGYGATNFLNSPGGGSVVDAFNRNRTASVGVALTMTYNVWDWGIRRRNVAIADRNVMVAENTLSRARLDATATTKKLVLNLEQLKNTYVMSRSLVASQEEIFGFLQRDYREGKVTPVDLIQNFRDLLDARVNVLQARTDLAVGLLQYHFYSADLAGFLGVGSGDGKPL